MPTIKFTPAEFAMFASSLAGARQKSILHGYNNNGEPGAGWMYTNDADGEQYTIIIDEADDKATITTNMLVVTLPEALTVTASQTIIADGVDTKTFDLDGELGRVVVLRWEGTEEIDKRSVTLDGFGAGSFVVGPYPAGRCTDAGGFQIQCSYADDTGEPTICTVIVGV